MKRSLFTTLIIGLSLSAALLATTTSKADEAATVYTMDNAIAANHVLMFQQQMAKSMLLAASQREGRAPEEEDCQVKDPSS